MRVIVRPDASAAAACVVKEIGTVVRDRPGAVLGFATGGTMEPVYAGLVSAVRAGYLSLDGVTSFNLDEYVGLASEHPQSYHTFMRTRLFEPLRMDPHRTHLPRGDAAEPTAEAARYETAIARAGGLDIQLLGLGANGHIGFNEPGTAFDSLTHVTTLAESTRADNARFFDADAHVPDRAITMGIGTILKARRVLLLATGERKADAVRTMIEGTTSLRCPASALQLHTDAMVVCDEAAAAGLSEGVALQ